MQFQQVIQPCDDSPEIYKILISLCFGIHPSWEHYQKFKTFKKYQEVAGIY